MGWGASNLTFQTSAVAAQDRQGLGIRGFDHSLPCMRLSAFTRHIKIRFPTFCLNGHVFPRTHRFRIYCFLIPGSIMGNGPFLNQSGILFLSSSMLTKGRHFSGNYPYYKHASAHIFRTYFRFYIFRFLAHHFRQEGRATFHIWQFKLNLLLRRFGAKGQRAIAILRRKWDNIVLSIFFLNRCNAPSNKLNCEAFSHRGQPYALRYCANCIFSTFFEGNFRRPSNCRVVSYLFIHFRLTKRILNRGRNIIIYCLTVVCQAKVWNFTFRPYNVPKGTNMLLRVGGPFQSFLRCIL